LAADSVIDKLSRRASSLVSGLTDSHGHAGFPAVGFKLHTTNLALARENRGRTSYGDVFDVDRTLFDYCCVSDAGSGKFGEFGSFET